MDTDDRQKREGEEPTAPQPEEPAQAQPEEPTAPQPEEPAQAQPEEPTQAQQGEEPTAAQEDPAHRQPPPIPPPQGPRRLFRSRTDRVLGGVGGGLGQYFNTDPIFFRIGLIVLAFLGGAGVLLYLAALLLVPQEPAAGETPPAPSSNRPRWAVIAVAAVLLLFSGVLVPLAFIAGAGIVVWWLVSGQGPRGEVGDIARRSALGLGVLVLCLLLALGGAWAAAAGGDGVVAAIVIAAGLALLAGAFLRPVRWLVLPAVLLALSAGTVAAADIELDGGVGESRHAPASAAELRDRYELGMGELVVDLRNADLPPGDTPLDVEVGLGHAEVIVPDDVCVASSAEVGAGEVAIFDRTSSGVDVDWVDRPSAPDRASRLVLDAQVGMGLVSVSHEEFDRDREGFGRFGDGDRFGDDDGSFGDDDDADRFVRGENTGCLTTAAR